MKKMVGLKRIILFILSIIILVLCILYFTLSFINLDSYKSRIEKSFEAYIGRTINIQGPMKLSLSTSHLVIKANDISIANLAGGHFPEMAHIHQVEFELGLVGLLKHQLNIKRMKAEGVHLWLETDQKGQGNWVFALNSSDNKMQQGELLFPPVKTLLINDVDLIYFNGETGALTKLAFSKSNLEIDEPLQALHIGTKGEYANSAIVLEGKGRLVSEQKPRLIYVDLKGSIGQINMLIKGTLSKPSDGQWLDLKINANGESTSDFHTLFGLELKPVEHFIVNTRLVAHAGVFIFDDIKARIGGSKFNGAIRIDKHANPVTTHARLHLKAYDAGSFLDHMGVTDILQQGKLYLTLSVTTQGKTQEQIIKNMVGKMEFQIEETFLKKWRLHQIAPDFLKSLGETHSDTVPVEAIDGQINVSAGVARFNHALMEGKHFLFKITGQMNFVNNSLAVELHPIVPYMPVSQKAKVWQITGQVGQPVVNKLSKETAPL